jgi:hypothetical protein
MGSDGEPDQWKATFAQYEIEFNFQFSCKNLDVAMHQPPFRLDQAFLINNYHFLNVPNQIEKKVFPCS